ncbi:MAG TPA: glycosyltransferase [Candidatus Polarisedimenticolia bacterium]|jgi:glycosyltransferase involved in cell wall biosynthesis
MKVMVVSGATYGHPSARGVFEDISAGGVEVLLAMPRSMQHPFGPDEVPESPTPSLELARLDTWHSHPNGTHLFMKGLPELIRRFEPDIIHCVFEPWALTCLEVLACLRVLALDVKFGIHAAEFNLHQGSGIAARVRTLIYRRVLAHCDYFLAWSPPALQLARSFGLRTANTDVVPAVGIDTDLFRPPRVDEKQQLRETLRIARSGEIVVGYVGRLVEGKGVTDLVAAMDLATREIGHLRLLIVGAGPLETHLKTAAISRPWMEVRGRLSQREVAELMRTLDFLVLPSRTTARTSEQFGLVLVEAMVSGVAVIGSTCGAIPHVIGESGWVFPEREVPYLGNLLALLASGNSETLARASRARSIAQSRFSHTAVANALVQIWQTTLGVCSDATIPLAEVSGGKTVGSQP